VAQAQSEENVKVERATRLFEALFTFFKQDPKGVIGLVHEIADGIVDTIIENEELRKELGYSAGQLKVLAHLFWYHDDKNVVQRAIADSENLEDIMDAISQLAKAYSMLKDGGTTTEEIKKLIDSGTSALYKVIEFIMSTADCDP
jgi:signal-transduction protein with cAMP-binding, CBS, and nucleotidyltransferase domain